MPTPVAHISPGPSLDRAHGLPETAGVVVVQVHEDPLGLVLRLLQGGWHEAVDFLLRILCSVLHLSVTNAGQCIAVKFIVMQNLQESIKEKVAGGPVWGSKEPSFRAALAFPKTRWHQRCDSAWPWCRWQ